ncbi:Sialic acid TRAP transporter permease protein SiaT [Planctomycetes bacterium Poly30]|uniref:Sialic acid TRAP transporter permease protein SiaT n=1 Tax=Saltatorellus ferox TaxID=2528018 RepID=A0A518EN48_9BACT|nr:Sialic acid TRAP transporter permease protein SiaT [Planctomycetes bacterium Poly30]
MPADWIGPAMFGTVMVLIFLGFPVAFTLGGAALLFGFLGIQLGYFNWAYLTSFPERLEGIMENQVLLAVPFFILMGTVLQRSRLAEDLLHTIGMLFGPRRGGLALAVVFVGALLAAATGVVGASVVAMGMISLPVMLRYGYSPSLATGTICAAGTLGQLIPPSIVLIVLGNQLGVSAGKLFRGALIPGLMLAGLYAVYVAFTAWRRPECAPALPAAERDISGPALAKRVFGVLIPPLALILIVLGSIFAGIATPTKAGALGAAGALLLALLRRRLSFESLRDSVEETAKLTTMVVFLLVGSTLFALVFRGVYGDDWIRDMLTGLPGGKIGLLVVANLVVFGLGFFIDFFEIAFIVLPLIVPAAQDLGITGDAMIWFGVMIAMNLQTSFLTPPFGFALFYLRSVTPDEVPTSTIYRGVIPFIAIQAVGLVLVIVFPELVTTLL